MADHADDNNDDGEVFVYRGGEAPLHVTHVRIDKSVDEIEANAFSFSERRLVKVETHEGIRKVGKSAFEACRSLPQINLKSVSEIGYAAFGACDNLVDVEFGEELETIGDYAFSECPLKHLKLPSVSTIGKSAFCDCKAITDIELSEQLETIGSLAFHSCKKLQRIAIPPKRDLFQIHEIWQNYDQFNWCEQLTTVDLVGGIHTTISSLHMDSWKNYVITEINRINQVLPHTNSLEKTEVIVQWLESVVDQFEHYKGEHYKYVKEGVTLLELALWKTKLDEKEENWGEGRAKKAKIDANSARKERRVTCGADMVIKNVLPYLRLDLS